MISTHTIHRDETDEGDPVETSLRERRVVAAIGGPIGRALREQASTNAETQGISKPQSESAKTHLNNSDKVVCVSVFGSPKSGKNRAYR